MSTNAALHELFVEAMTSLASGVAVVTARKANGDPNFNISFYVLGASGDYAGVLDDALELSSYASRREAQISVASVPTPARNTSV